MPIMELDNKVRIELPTGKVFSVKRTIAERLKAKGLVAHMDG